MSTLLVNNMAVSFPPTVAGQTASTKTFTVKNNGASSVTFTGVMYVPGGGDLVTLPSPAQSVNQNSFSIVPTSSIFPVTVASLATQSFTVTYTPDLSEGGTDTRSITAYLSNSASIVCSINLGGGVLYPSFAFPTASPVMGIPMTMNLADIDGGHHYDPIILLEGATAGGTGPWVSVGARSVQILVFFEDITAGCTLTINKNTTGGAVQVAQWTGLTYANVGGLFIGPQSQQDLQGLQLQAVVSSVLNAKTISIGAYVIA